MPNYGFECDNCKYSYDKFYSLKEWGFPLKNIKCPKCNKKTVSKVISPVGFEIKGWSAGKELARYKHVQLAEECMEEAKKKGVSKMEQEEGLGLMADREKKKGLESGTLSGKREIKYETKNGKRVLKGGRKEALSKRARVQREMRKK